MNSIRIYDEAVISYLKQITITDGEETRIPQVAFAIPSRLDTKLILSDNNMPLLPMFVITRESLEPNEASGIVKTHSIRPYIYVHDNKKEKVYGIDAMPYIFNYKIDTWNLSQNLHLEMINKLIWKFEKYRTIYANFTINNFNLRTNGYIENYSFSDETTYNEISESNIRLIKSSFNIKVFGWLFEEDYVKKTVLKNIQKVVIADGYSLTKDKLGNIISKNDEIINLKTSNLKNKKIKLDYIKNILLNFMNEGIPPVYTESNGTTWTINKLREEYLKIDIKINLEEFKRKKKVYITTTTDEEGNIIKREEIQI
ncbi:MAG: hypothetical protein EOL97_11880 [Spirochaetia bacterium]|nr:hypothetical protein [Spirochaetia bacterium]